MNKLLIKVYTKFLKEDNLPAPQESRFFYVYATLNKSKVKTHHKQKSPG